MVVFSMNSKRLRRPNVRLWDIGDLSAAFLCGSYNRSDASLGQRKRKRNFSHLEEPEFIEVTLEKQATHAIFDHNVSLRSFEDIRHNCENKDPNSLEIVSELVNSDETNMSKCELDFGTITRKPRLMKRRRRNPNSISNLFGDAWKSSPSHETTSKDEEGYGLKHDGSIESNGGFTIYHVSGIKDSSETETSAMSKEACNNETEGAWFEENRNFLQSNCRHNKKVSSDGNVNSVSEWLEQLGFGKFAILFKLHEVDNETLPLLTFEDLKDMGIAAVGPRWKLFTAIQQLRGGS